MTFEEFWTRPSTCCGVVGTWTYGALKRQFALDDALLEDVKVERIKGQRLAMDMTFWLPQIEVVLAQVEGR